MSGADSSATCRRVLRSHEEQCWQFGDRRGLGQGLASRVASIFSENFLFKKYTPIKSTTFRFYWHTRYSVATVVPSFLSSVRYTCTHTVLRGNNKLDGCGWLRTSLFGEPSGRPMSRSRRLSADMMMMMIASLVLYDLFIIIQMWFHTRISKSSAGSSWVWIHDTAWNTEYYMWNYYA